MLVRVCVYVYGLKHIINHNCKIVYIVYISNQYT